MENRPRSGSGFRHVNAIKAEPQCYHWLNEPGRGSLGSGGRIGGNIETSMEPKPAKGRTLR